MFCDNATVLYNTFMNIFSNLYDRVFRRHKDVWKTDLMVMAGILVVLSIFAIWQPELPTEDVIDRWTERFGVFGPLSVIIIIIVETVIAPIPGTIIPIAIGALYGVWPGMLYAWVGNVTGSIIAFWISRKFGRPIVERFLHKDKIKRYDSFLHRSKMLIWLVYAIPIFPIDMISFIIGLSSIKFKRFLVIVSVGFTINLFILTFFGERLLSSSGLERILYGVGVIVLILIATTVEKLQFEKGKDK